MVLAEPYPARVVECVLLEMSGLLSGISMAWATADV